jgi:SlyX protein
MSSDPERQTEARLTELEIKLAFTEDLVERLDTVVIEQQRQIDRLMQELLRLREQMQQAGSATSGPSGDERPPHY